MITLALVGLLQLATDATRLEGSVAAIRGEGWAVYELETVLALGDTGLRGEFAIAQATLLESGQTVDDIRIVCASIELSNRSVSCRNATFAARVPGLGTQTAAGEFTYDRLSGVTRLTLSQLPVAGGALRLEGTVGEAGLDLQFSGEQLQLDALLQLALGFEAPLEDFSATGFADINGRFDSTGDAGISLSLDADIDGAALANAAGTIAAEGISGRVELDLALGAADTAFDIALQATRGEAYLEPLYANFSTHALRLRAEAVHTADFVDFDIGGFHLEQDTLLDMSGSARLTLPADPDLEFGISAELDLRDCSVSRLYESVIQVQFAGGLLGDLETDGRVSGALHIVDSTPTLAELRLSDVILDDRQGRFAIYGLAGNVHWRADPGLALGPSRLGWDSGTVYNIMVGGGEVGVQLGDNDIELLTPLRVPTMGGALRINQLVLNDYGSDQASGVLDAELEPIQLGQLSGAFGWPAFSGTLSGRLPLLQLAEQTVTVGGTLTASAFDGTMQMANLRIDQPFGRVPRLRGDLQLRNLDLQRVTEAFSFGLIQGRLSGDVTGLRMRNWQLVEMDMHFYTPDNDKSQHRISQRAVENLASVGGGGAAAVLSTGFLKYFEVFAYETIGLRCVLRNNTCAMSGAGPAKDGAQGPGYYIVKGRGLPRIDVVGYRNQVSWPRLLQQLEAITESGAPTVN